MSTAGQQGQGQQAGQQGAAGQVPGPGQQQAAPPQNVPQPGQVPGGQQGTGQVPAHQGTGQVPAHQGTGQVPVPQNVPQPGSSPTHGGQVDLSTLDPAVQKYIADLRAENASDRRTAKDQAVQEAQRDFAQKIGAALGIVPPGQAPDPAVLQQQVVQHQQALMRERVENYAYRRAGGLGANPDALLDSRGFLTTAHQLDPTAADFGAQIDAAITAAVTANPLLKSGPGQVPAPPQFAPNPGQQAGNGPPPQQSSVAAGRALYAQKNAKQT